ncbi:MAG: DMT family transporter [Desulfobulbia bacterium]
MYPEKDSPSKFLPLAMFWLLGIIWGSNFIYMKLASGLISPLQIVLLRVLFGFIPVALYAYYKETLKWSHIKHIGHFLVMSLIATIAYYYGFVKGSSLLLSGVAGALSGLTPILSFLVAIMFLEEEKASCQKLFGIGIGFLGVLLIARPFSHDIAATNIEGALFNVFGSLSVGASFVYAKKYVLPLNLPFSALITYQLGLSLLILFLFTDMEGIGNVWSNAYVATGLAVGLGILGTGLAYLIYYYIIEKLGAVSASSVTYIPPVVAIAIGVIIVGEKINAWEYFGIALIFVGLVLINKKLPISKSATHGE